MNKFIKKISALVLVVTLGFSLSACSDEKIDTTTPYGDLNGNYATYNNVSLSNKTLYDMMRLQGNSIFLNEVEKIILADYISAINLSNDDDLQDVVDNINLSFWGTDEVEDIFYMSDSDKTKTIQQIIDSLFMSGVVITEDDITITQTTTTYSTEILDFFKINVAKENFGHNLLTELVDKEEIEDPNGDDGDMIDNPYFISDEDIENYYNNTYRNQQEFNAIIVGFNNLTAYETAMVGFNTSNIKSSFITLYNNAFPYKETMTVDNFDELTIMDSDKLSAYNTSLSAFVKGMDENTYTTTYKEFGDKIYMIYKITDLSDLKWDELEGSNEFTTSDIEIIEAEIREELFDAKLTSSFITSKITEEINNLSEDNKIKIYDPLFSLAFAAKYDYEDAGLTSTTDVADINGTKITVQNLFDTLEECYGLTIALDYFINVAMVGNFTLTDDEKDEAEDAYDAAVENYENNNYASYGLTSDFTLSQFLSMQYGYSSKSDALKYYFQPQAGAHYFTEEYDDLYFQLFESVGQYTYEQYFSLDIVHMLLFVDADLDGNLDNPEEFMRDLSAANEIAFKQTIIDIYSHVYEEASFLALGYEQALNYIVQAYNEGATIAYTIGSGNELTWNDVKDFNIQMKVENLGEVNNSNSSSYVESFSTHVKETYFNLEQQAKDNSDDEDFEDTFTELLEKENLEEITTSTNFDDLCMSTFGFHMLLSTDGSMATSAKFNIDNDYKTSSGLYAYEEIEIELNGVTETVTGWTDNNWPSVDQLKVYISEMDGDDGVYSLKSSTETIIDSQITVFNTRYNSDSFFAYLLITKYDLLAEITFTNNDSLDKLIEILEISKRTIDSYSDSNDTVYANWWDILDSYQAN